MKHVKQKKKRGRPATGKRPITGVRLSAEITAKLDAWAKANGHASRSDAIRYLIERALAEGMQP